MSGQKVVKSCEVLYSPASQYFAGPLASRLSLIATGYSCGSDFPHPVPEFPVRADHVRAVQVLLTERRLHVAHRHEAVLPLLKLAAPARVVC